MKPKFIVVDLSTTQDGYLSPSDIASEIHLSEADAIEAAQTKAFDQPKKEFGVFSLTGIAVINKRRTAFKRL